MINDIAYILYIALQSEDAEIIRGSSLKAPRRSFL